MPPDILQRIRKALKGANLSHVARETNMTVRQVRNIRDGVTKGPRWDTVTRLAKHLKLPIG